MLNGRPKIIHPEYRWLEKYRDNFPKQVSSPKCVLAICRMVLILMVTVSRSFCSFFTIFIS